MLVIHGDKALGRADLHATFVFVRDLWLNIVERRGLTLDTRLAPALKGAARPGTCIYLVQRGTLVAHGDGGATHHGPVALVLSEQQFEGAEGQRRFTFEAHGDPFSVIEMHVTNEADAIRVAAEPFAVDPGEEAWARVAEVIALARSRAKEATLAPAVRDLLRVVSSSEVITPRLVGSSQEPVPFEKLWRAVSPLADRFDLAVTLGQLGALADVSSRQLDRYFRAFFAMFPLPGGSWRAATVHLRIKVAVLFLSADDVSVADVARAVGYGSVAAMGRAFRDAGLASPSAIREQLTSRVSGA